MTPFPSWAVVPSANVTLDFYPLPPFSVTVVVLLTWDYAGSVQDLVAGFKKHVFANKYETLKMAVPSLVYALQVSGAPSVSRTTKNPDVSTGLEGH